MANEGRLESKLTRRFAPFAAAGLLALLAPLLPPRPDDWTPVVIAALLSLAIAASAVLLPWSRMPRWTYIVPPLAYFGVVALLREANDGSVSGYAPLALLPVIWIALNLGVREVAIGIGVGVSVFVLPQFVGDPEQYTSEDWRRAILWTATAVIVGFSVESIVSGKRTQTRIAHQQRRTIAAVVSVTRSLTKDVDARTDICRATVDIAGATFAAIWEPDPSGDLVLTGHAGPEPGRSRFGATEEPSGTVRAFTTAARYIAPDAVGDTSLARDEVAGAGVVSMLFEPIVQDGASVGVLAVGWSRRVDDVNETTAQAVMLLASEAAAAIERADLLAGLNEMAETDELTGLPNRRAWDETIRRAVGYASRTHRTVCVAVVDLDRFKEYNDAHGHQAGDRLLKTAAAAWRSALRSSDMLARYGGEEFAIVLPSCSALEAAGVLERLRLVTPEGQTCSVGLAEWRPGESHLDLVARADEALYRAKRRGRDGLVLAGAS
jgi:diguanylate cyclase (GGDEF)-like protein